VTSIVIPGSCWLSTSAKDLSADARTGRAASGARFTRAERAGGLGGAAQHPPARALIGSPRHRSISPSTTSKDPISAMMSAIIIPFERTWKMLMAVKHGLFTLTRYGFTPTPSETM